VQNSLLPREVWIMTNDDFSGSESLPVVAPRTLEQLADRANQAHAEVLVTAQDAVKHALVAGQALADAKLLCRPGHWYAWLTEHFRGSKRTAQAYMRLATRVTLAGGYAQISAHLRHDQLRCMLTGLTAGDGRVRAGRGAARRKQARAEVEPQPPVARREELAASLSYIHVRAGYEKVARSLREVLAELDCLCGEDNVESGGYARHLFQRLRAVYFELENLRRFDDWRLSDDGLRPCR
jgi:hypothetical protein